MSMFDEPQSSPSSRTRNTSSGGLSVFTILLSLIFIALLAAVIGVIVLSLLQGRGNTTIAPLPTTINAYAANATQVIRCADPVNNCGNFSQGISNNESPGQAVPPAPTATPLQGADADNISGQQVTQVPADVTPAAPEQNLLNTQDLPVLSEAELDMLFQPQPVPPIVDGLSASDRQFFDRALDNTFAARSFRYDIDMNLDVTTATDQGAVGLSVTGIAENIFTGVDGSFAFSGAFTPTSTLPEFQVNQSAELRVIGEDLFINLETPDGQSLWIQTDFDELSAVGMESAGFDETLDAVGFNLDTLDTVPEVLDLLAFDGFVNTTRRPNQGNEAHFSTAFDIKGFLKSELLDSVLISLVTFSGVDMNQPDIEGQIRTQARIFQSQVDQLLPRFDLTIDRYVSLTDERLTRILIDLDVSIADPSGQIGDTAIRGDVSIALSGYDQGLTVEAPANAVPVTAEQLNELQAQIQTSP